MKITDELRKLNYGCMVKIRCKIGKSKQSLYLEYNKDNLRHYKYPKLYIIEDKNKNKQTMRMIQEIRDKLEYELHYNSAGIEVMNQKEKKILLYDYAKKIIEHKPVKTGEFYMSGINSLIKHAGSLNVSRYSPNVIQNWQAAMTHSQVTKHNYLRAVKYIFNKAIKDKFIKQNPCEGIICSYPESKREFLTIDEIRVIASVDFERPVIKDAFIFSCFTGLRLGDIRTLKWENIVDGYLEHTQSKTGHSERMKFSPTALEIIQRQPKHTPNVFMLQAQKRFYIHFRRLMKLSGLTKHITFHCGRHSFATLLLTYGEDIYTVSKLLGHHNVATTQIYAKLIDKKKDEAIDKLPVL